MFDAQLLFDGATVYSPWFPRGGDNVRITLDVIALTNTELTVSLYTKRKEDAGDGANADSDLGSPTEILGAAAGRTTVEWLSRGTVGLKDLVRFKFVADGDQASDWILFRMLRPQWFDSVATAT